jgi:phospholipase C
MPGGIDGVGPTRRQVLAAGLIGAASLAGCSKASKAGNAGRITTTTCLPKGLGSLAQIEHVVIVIQENRSFDHYLGSLRGVRGFDDHPPGSAGPFSQPAPTGQAGARAPFHLDTTTTKAACTNDVTHDWAPQHACWNGGAMDGWARTHATEDGVDGAVTMGYYTRADLPYYYALADAFTVCDAYHCSVLGPTGPNRVYSVSAWSDPNATQGGPIVATEDFKTSTAAKFSRTWTTMPERMQSQGVSWKVYQQPGFDTNPSALAISNNPLFYFRAYSDPASSLYRRAFLPSWPDEFRRDVANGGLPSVSWVLSGLGQDEHPPSSPQVGENFTSQLMATLMAQPAVWAKTVVFFTYDENGGFFDHVAPPTPPPGTPGEYLTMSPLPGGVKGVAGPIGLGFRVPMLVASPFSRGGWVCSDRFDHTSLLRFIETRFSVEVPNLSAWRRAATGDLTSTLDLGAADPSIPTLPSTAAEQAVVARECPANEIVMPVPTYPVPPNPPVATQESGAARRRASACAAAG